MDVVATDSWFEEYNVEKNVERLVGLFPNEGKRAIYAQLVSFGMEPFHKRTKERLNSLRNAGVYDLVDLHLNLLKKKWNGSSVPVYILPSNQNNYRLTKELNGKSGVAFQDKLFLFLQPNNRVPEIKAVLTHEYNHVCRMKKQSKYTFLDTVVLEGLAEHAVRLEIGENELAHWTKNYDDQTLMTFWNRYIEPNKDVERNHPLHDKLLYGSVIYPKMLGYAAGFFAVGKALKKVSMEEALFMSSEKLVNF